MSSGIQICTEVGIMYFAFGWTRVGRGIELGFDTRQNKIIRAPDTGIDGSKRGSEERLKPELDYNVVNQ